MEPFVDNFARPLLGDAPNGLPYENSTDWFISSDALHPQVDGGPLVWDTYRSNGTFTLDWGADSPGGAGLVFRWAANDDYVYAFKINAFFIILKFHPGGITSIKQWGPTLDPPADEILPAVTPTSSPRLTIVVDGPQYTIKMYDTLIGTAIDPDPRGQKNTRHGLFGSFYLSGAGSTVQPAFSRMTAAFNLTDHLLLRAGVPRYTRPPLVADHNYAHHGALKGLLYKLPTDPFNLAPVGLSRHPIDLRITDTGGPYAFVDELGNELADDDGAPLIFD